jgi:hypothetical protein
MIDWLTVKNIEMAVKRDMDTLSFKITMNIMGRLINTCKNMEKESIRKQQQEE